METSMSALEEPLQTPTELLESLVPQVPEPELFLEYPREVVERYLYEREGYWKRILSQHERAAMLDYIREVSYVLAWDLFSEEDVSVMPEETRKAISLQTLLEYCSGVFRRLSHLIALIDQSPNQQIARERVFVDFSLTRKAGPGSINWLMSHPRSHRFERPAPNSTIAPNLRQVFSQRSADGEEVSYLPSEIAETQVRIDYNTYENRFVRRFLTTMHSDINTIANLAAMQEENEIRAEAEALMRKIGELLQYDFLKYSSPAFSARRPPAAHRQPYYHQIYEIYRHYRRIFDFDWGNPLFKLPLRRTWLIYEYWCFFKVIDVLKSLGFKLVKDRVTLFFENPESKLTLELPRGQASILELLRESDADLVTVLYSGETSDPTFLNPADGVYHPVAPTIFMMFEGKAYLFDVKFKTYTANGSWHDDLDRLHGYRDALGASGAVVQEAWCLYPASGVNGQMRPVSPDSVYEPEKSPPDGGVGLLAVHPSDDTSWRRLVKLLGRWFPDLSLVASSPQSPGEVSGQNAGAERQESLGTSALPPPGLPPTPERLGSGE